jgi:ATP-dependent Clp endopeptidase proteolytic subunit ClpP
MPKPWYSIKAVAADSDVAEVSILDAINDWYGVGARGFLTDFRAIKQSKVRVYINSPGGSVTEALAIFNGMRASGKEIEVHVLGIAASAASYIAMAGDKIVMPANTLMFLHNPINGVYGNADDMRDMADTLDKFAEVLTNTYMKRWKGEEQALKDVLSAETFLTAAECLEHGLCDEVVDEITATASFDVDAMPDNVQALFKRTQPQPVAVVAPALADIERVAKAAGVGEFAGVFALDKSLTTLAAFEAAAADAKNIVDLCRITGTATDAAGHIRARKSFDDVRALIAAAQAADDESTSVNTAPPIGAANPKAKAEFNPITLWGQINAMRNGGK